MLKKTKIYYMMQDVKSANNCIYKCISSHYESPSYISHCEIIKNLFLTEHIYYCTHSLNVNTKPLRWADQ